MPSRSPGTGPVPPPGALASATHAPAPPEALPARLGRLVAEVAAWGGCTEAEARVLLRLALEDGAPLRQLGLMLPATRPRPVWQRALLRYLGPGTQVQQDDLVEMDMWVLTVWPEPRGWRAEGTHSPRRCWRVYVTGQQLDVDAWALLRAALARLGVPGLGGL